MEWLRRIAFMLGIRQYASGNYVIREESQCSISFCVMDINVLGRDAVRCRLIRRGMRALYASNIDLGIIYWRCFVKLWRAEDMYFDPGKYKNGEENYMMDTPFNIARYLVNNFVGRNYEYVMRE